MMINWRVFGSGCSKPWSEDCCSKSMVYKSWDKNCTLILEASGKNSIQTGSFHVLVSCALVCHEKERKLTMNPMLFPFVATTRTPKGPFSPYPLPHILFCTIRLPELLWILPKHSCQAEGHPESQQHFFPSLLLSHIH
jgi:hypothetical protein